MLSLTMGTIPPDTFLPKSLITHRVKLTDAMSADETLDKTAREQPLKVIVSDN